MLLKVTNRGSSVTEIVPQTTYSVGVPVNMRGKKVFVEVIQGSIQFECLAATVYTIAELGVSVHWNIHGSSTEGNYGSNQFSGNAFTSLFEVDMTKILTLEKVTNFQMAGRGASFVINQMPENLTFSRYSVAEMAVLATALVAGRTYQITSAGNSDWTTAGAPNSNNNTIFTSTGVTTGTGVAWQLGTKTLMSDFKHIGFTLQMTEVE